MSMSTDGSRVRSIAAASLPWFLLMASLALAFGRARQPSAIVASWRPWAEIGALACGMTAVIVSGGIDLSVGSLTALCGVVLGLTWSRLGWPIPLACGASVLAGALGGALNGVLVALGIAPSMATLATMACFSGLALALRGGVRSIDGFPGDFTRLGRGDFLGVPGPFWLLLGVASMATLLLHMTRFGRSLYAIGDNRTAAEFAAVPVRRRLWWLFTLNGLLAGLVAVSMTASGGTSIDDAGAELELPLLSIAAVVLGGTRVNGGAGGIGRTLIGVATLAHFGIGLRTLGDVAVRLPGTGMNLALDDGGRLVLLGLAIVAVAVLNERLADPRPRTRSPPFEG